MERKVSSLPPGRHGAGSSLGSRCGKWSSKLFSLSSRLAESVSREADPCPASQQELKVSTSGLCVCRCVMKTVTLHIYARPLSPGPVSGCQQAPESLSVWLWACEDRTEHILWMSLSMEKVTMPNDHLALPVLSISAPQRHAHAHTAASLPLDIGALL